MWLCSGARCSHTGGAFAPSWPPNTCSLINSLPVLAETPPPPTPPPRHPMPTTHTHTHTLTHPTHPSAGYLLGKAAVPKHAIITAVAGRPTQTLDEFVEAVRVSVGGRVGGCMGGW